MRPSSIFQEKFAHLLQHVEKYENLEYNRPGKDIGIEGFR